MKVGTLSLDDLILYLGHSSGEVGSYPSAEMQLVYFTAPADWAKLFQVFLLSAQLNVFNYCYVTLIFQFNISHLFTQLNGSI